MLPRPDTTTTTAAVRFHEPMRRGIMAFSFCPMIGQAVFSARPSSRLREEVKVNSANSTRKLATDEAIFSETLAIAGRVQRGYRVCPDLHPQRSGNPMSERKGRTG